MATFHIHQDSGKENSQVQPIKPKQQTGKDTRSTFAVLNNVTQVPRQGKKTFGQKKSKNEKENDLGRKAFANAARILEQKKISGIPVEQFKSFSVYEDDSWPPEVIVKDVSNSNNVTVHSENLGCASASTTAAATSNFRNPLKEISHRDGILETPMSVSDIHSPMSIDKSVLAEDDENKPPQTVSLIPPRNDRERFFDVEEYQKSILEYFRELETKHRPKPSYMKRQPDINYSMRTILVDWLVEVAEEYRLQSETLCLAVSYIDRFLSYMSVVRAKLQLVGTAAMFIAAKYEEIYPPDVSEFVFITDDTYTKAQVLRMEIIILKILSFDLSAPTTLVFINTYASMYEISDQVKYLSSYLCELSLLEADPFLQYLPSQISAAALALARYNLDLPIWAPELEEITSYSLENLKDVILHLCQTHNTAVTMAQQAIQDKYKTNKYLHVSTITPMEFNESQFNELLEQYNKYTLSVTLKKDEDHAVAAANENVRKMISSLIFV